ncbi:NAD(P)-dependent oxidoreductase [soil metagenome]
MNRVLITGAAGRLGHSLRQTLRGAYPILRLSDLAPLGTAEEGEELDRTDITDYAAVEKMVEGVDAVVHLGGIAAEAQWAQIAAINITGTFNVFEAARNAGVKRIVFASSNHAMGFYPRSQTIDHASTPRPDSRYGVSKAAGEAIASLYAHRYGIGVLSVRIGNFNAKPLELRHLSIWVSGRDLAQLVRIGIDHPGIVDEVVYGVSGNSRSWWDNRNAQRLGYVPQDNAEDFAAEILAREETAHPVAARFQGGKYCTVE